MSKDGSDAFGAMNRGATNAPSWPGLAEAKAGRDGGYRLTRPSAQISLLEIVEAAEGTLALERCILRGGPCHWEQVCALHGAWSATVQASRDALQATTLADLVEADERLIAGRSADPEPTGHLARADAVSGPPNRPGSRWLR